MDKVTTLNNQIYKTNLEVETLTEQQRGLIHLINDYEDATRNTEKLYDRLIYRYGSSNSAFSLEQHRDEFQQEKQAILEELIDNQGNVKHQIRKLNDCIEVLEAQRNIELHKANEKGHDYEH